VDTALVGQHVGFDQEHRRRQDVGNEILAADDALVDGPVHLEMPKRIGLETHRRAEADPYDRGKRRQ